MANFILLTVCVFGTFALDKMSATAKSENGQCFRDCWDCSDLCYYQNVTFCCDAQPLNCWENITICNAKCNGSECAYSIYVKHCCFPNPLSKFEKMHPLVMLGFLGAFTGLGCSIFLTNMEGNWKRCWKKCTRCKVKPGSLIAIFRKKTKDYKLKKLIANPPINLHQNQSDSTSAASAKRNPNHLSSGSCGNDSVSTISEDYALGTPAGGSPPPSYKSRTSSCSSSTRL